MPTLPGIEFPLIGNSLAIGLFALLHILLAGLGVGFMMLAPPAEWAGERHPWLLDAARSMTRFTIVTYTASVVLAVIMVQLFIGLFPVTNAYLFNRFRYPIYVAMIAFLLQLLALYPYYHYWDALRARSPGIHRTLGFLAALLMLIWVAVLDGIGSYMLTPAPADDVWSRLANPTWIPLIVHRFLGNLVMAGYVMAGYAAWRLAAARGEDVDYYVHLLKMGLLIGFIMLMIQPLSGLLYARAISMSAPEAYRQLTQGPYQPWIYAQFLLIGALFLGSHVWLHRVSSAGRPGRWRLVAAGSFALAMVLSVGYPDPDLRRGWTFALVALSAVVLYRARRLLADGSSSERYQRPFIRFLSTALAVVAVMTYLTMGTIRETARRPDTVRNVISLHDEARQPAAFRQGVEDQPKGKPPQTEHPP
ncbi:MAG: cytochrome ubiquinol oxidase subunit I [Nitrospira sp.]|nr:cytochrome ubiquinol oxidase subunit I [Nitrospira sp.]